MFERCTEDSRRIIFYSRHEALQAGSAEIAPHHILLGMLHDPKVRFDDSFHLQERSIRIRKAIEQAAPSKAPIATTDIPLDTSSKRTLAYAREESELLNQNWIEPEHIVLGLLREQGSLAAFVLAELGIAIEEVRTKAAAIPPTPPPQPIRRLIPPSVSFSFWNFVMIVILCLLIGWLMAVLWSLR